jgi:hypothetical protein
VKCRQRLANEWNPRRLVASAAVALGREERRVGFDHQAVEGKRLGGFPKLVARLWPPAARSEATGKRTEQ